MPETPTIPQVKELIFSENQLVTRNPRPYDLYGLKEVRSRNGDPEYMLQILEGMDPESGRVKAPGGLELKVKEIVIVGEDGETESLPVQEYFARYGRGMPQPTGTYGPH